VSKGQAILFEAFMLHCLNDGRTAVIIFEVQTNSVTFSEPVVGKGNGSMK
jgi:hypothetical protein